MINSTKSILNSIKLMPAFVILALFTLLSIALAPYTIITWDAQPIVEDAYRLINGQIPGRDYASPFGLLTATTGALGLLLINKYWSVLIGSSIYLFCIGLVTLEISRKVMNSSYSLCAMSLIYSGFALTYRLPGYGPTSFVYVNLYNHVSTSILICISFILYTFRDRIISKGGLIFLLSLLTSLFFGKIAYYFIGIGIIFIHALFYSEHCKPLAAVGVGSLLIGLLAIYAFNLNEYLKFSYQVSIISISSYGVTGKVLSVNYILKSFLGTTYEYALEAIGVIVLACHLAVSNERKISLYGLIISGLLCLLCSVATAQPPEPIFYALFLYIFIENYLARFSCSGKQSNGGILVLLSGLFLVFHMVWQNHQIALKNFIPAIRSGFSMAQAPLNGSLVASRSTVSNDSCGLYEAIKYSNPVRVGGQDLTFFVNNIHLPKNVPLYWHSGVTFSQVQYAGTALDDVNVIILDGSAMPDSIRAFEELFRETLSHEFSKTRSTELCTVFVRNSATP